MPTNERETEIIMEHVFKNKENLEVALDIISITQEIRERIIQSFLGKLKKVICEELDMSPWVWKTGLCDKPYEANYRNFGVSREFDVLNDSVYIVIQNQAKDLSNFYIGVNGGNPKCNAKFHASMKYLNRKLNKTLGKGNGSNSWWIWYQSLKKPSDNWDYTDWNNKDTLIKMHIKTDCVVENIGNRLLEIIEVAKPVIEEWVEQNPSAP